MEFGKRPGAEENPFDELDIAGPWAESVEQDEFRKEYMDDVLQRWLPEAGVNVLDAGCGQGYAAKFCQGKKYVGLEQSEELLKYARQLYGDRGKFTHGSIYKIPFNKDRFDSAFSIMVWFHLQNIGRASEELSRVVKESGPLLIINPNSAAYDVWETWYRKFPEFKKFDGGFVGPVRIPGKKPVILRRNIFYTHPREEIIEKLNNAGLVLVDSQTFGPFEGRNLFEYFKLRVRN